MATSTLPPVNQSGAKNLTGFPNLGQSKRSKSRTPRVSPRHSVGKLAGVESGDVGAYRNSYQHNLCLDILQEGYVSSFIELFELFNQQTKDRESAGSDSGVHEVPLLVNQPEKLDILKAKLTEAEDARRKGAPEKAYQSYLDLAHHFEQFPSDEWLIDHFHERCMGESQAVKEDDGRKQAEANFNIGIALEKRGDLSAAVEYLEKFYNLTTDQDWQDAVGDSLHDQAALQLYRTYTSLAEEIYEEAPQMSIEYLKKAYHMANEGGDRTEAGLASHRLGNIYEAVGDPEVATMYHKGYLDRCKRDKDNIGMGKAYEALARCEQSDGKLEEATQNYLEFVKIAEEVADKGVISQACSSLANLYNMLGEYENAVEYYNRAAENMETDDRERLELNLRLSMVVATQSEILSALIFEKSDLFESICNPEVSESEGNEGNESETAPEKPDLQFRDQFGQTPLEKASVLGRVALVPKLMEQEGVDVNLADPQGYTSLHKAASWGRMNSVKCLLENGADLSLKTSHGETARDIAVRYGHEGTINILDLTKKLQDFRLTIKDIHSQVTDPERIVGKLNKEEKNLSNKICEETEQWTSSPEAQSCSLTEVEEKEAQFIQTMDQYVSKLAPPPAPPSPAE